MVELKEQIQNALVELRKEKQRKFDQTADLIINLQKFDLKKTSISLFVNVPHKIKENKVAGFLETESKSLDSIIPEQFKRYSEKKKIKELIRKYDFFIAQSSVMPKVAMSFGRALGPAGKMPSPQLGIILNADDKSIAELKNKINHNVKVKAKEASIKVAIGKQSMKNEEICENALAVYNALLKALPREKDNVKNIEIKFTMTKPIKIKIR